MSVDTAMHRPIVTRHDTQRDTNAPRTLRHTTGIASSIHLPSTSGTLHVLLVDPHHRGPRPDEHPGVQAAAPSSRLRTGSLVRSPFFYPWVMSSRNGLIWRSG